MIKSKKVTQHFSDLFTSRAIYVWGFNCEIINGETIKKAINSHKGDKKYNEAYYLAKLKEGEGHFGADCSGSFYPVSGYDTTAQGYYNKCVSKGKVEDIPSDKPCMVFIRENLKIVHIGWYDGKGRVYEMKNSKQNCRHDLLSARKWTYFGIPAFVDYSDLDESEGKCMIELNVLRKGDKGEQVKTLQRLLKALGYSVGLSGADGDFGKNTEKALIKYQKKEGLTQDGICGQKTWESLLK